MMNRSKLTRRWFLRGAGGLTLGLPLLDASHAQTGATEPLQFALFIVGANGVAQEDPNQPGEVEKFWPRQTGALSAEALRADDTEDQRTLGMLADHAPRLLMVRGVDQPYGSAGCDHQSGDNMCLTSARINGGGNSSLANGESIDNRIARERNPNGRDPVTLRAGWRPNDATGYDNPGFVSYSGPNQPRAAEPSPLKAYERIVGLAAGADDASEVQRLLEQRASINDRLRAQIDELMAKPALSSDDRQRLQQHFDFVRDMEISMTATELDAAVIAEMEAVEGDLLNMDNHPAIIRLQMDILAFAVSSGYSLTGTLKIGDRIDSHQWVIGGQRLPQFHMISHRNMSDATGGAPIDNAFDLHRQVDRMHAEDFIYFIDRLESIDTPTGPLLDQGYAVWTNQMATGWHQHDNQPFVIAGSGAGYLKNGVYVDAGGVVLNRMLNTLLNAAGVQAAGGGPVEDFGEPSLTPGQISELIA